MKLYAIIILALLSSFGGCHAQRENQNNSFKLMATIPLPGVSGRIDHSTFDITHQILFIAALGNNTVEVVDIKNKKVIHTIKNLNEPQGVIFIPESNSLFVANGGNGECDVFNTASATYPLTATIKLSGDADNVRYDSADQKIYVGYGDGGIAIIDAIHFKLITTIKLAAHPESFQLDKANKKIYVNVPDKKQIEIIDLDKNLVIDQWKMTTASANFPMSLDSVNHRLFIGCRHTPKLLIMDTQNGKTITSFDIDSDADDIFYDNTLKQVYISCGNGYVDIFKQRDANRYSASEKIHTLPGARTSIFISPLSWLIVVSPSGFNRDASLLLYSIK